MMDYGIKAGMKVKISEVCPYTERSHGISDYRKKRLLGKDRIVKEVRTSMKYSNPIAVIDGWYFDLRDLVPFIKPKEFLESEEIKKVVEENKKEKDKKYFNPETL